MTSESKLPAQLAWRDFVRVLKALGYTQTKNTRGSARSFQSTSREPSLVTFHGPHGKETIREGTLREYLRKLRLERGEFLKLLDDR